VSWILVLLVGGLIAFGQIPHLQNKIKEAHVIDKTFVSAPFDQISLQGNYLATVIQGEQFSITATGDEEELNNTSLSFANQTFSPENHTNFRWCIFCTTQPVHFFITMPHIQGVDLHGSSSVVLKGFTSSTEHFLTNVVGASTLLASELHPQKFVALAHGVSNIKIDNLTATSTEIDSRGASKITLKGTSNTLNIKSYGASQINTSLFQSKNVLIDSSGASELTVWATQQLQTKVTGASKVYYKGNPELKNSTSGASEVLPLE
jgi:hypothetical protein